MIWKTKTEMNWIIKVFQLKNLKYLHTNKEASSETKKTFSNVNKQDRVNGQGQTYAPGSQTNHIPYQKKWDNNPKNGQRRPVCCFVCQEPHLSYSCPLVTQEKGEEKLKSSLKDKGICLKCLFKHTEGCKNPKAPYICTVYNSPVE